MAAEEELSVGIDVAKAHLDVALGRQGEVFRVAPGETPAITKFLQKLQFTKKLYVISENIERIFDEFRASLPFIEAAGGLVVDDAAKVLMIFRNRETINLDEVDLLKW